MNKERQTKILVVEDESIVAKNIQIRLKRLGYAVPAIVSTGKEAIKKAKELYPDLVLMDIVLKGDMDGIEAARQIYSRFNIPVVYLTAYSDESTFQRAKVTEPFGYVLKPFEVRTLRSVIEIALHKDKAEKKLRDRNKWLDNALRSINDNVVFTDTRGLITFMNPNAEATLGWKQEKALGKDLTELFSLLNEQGINLTESYMKKAIEDGPAFTLLNHTLRVSKDSKEVPVDISAAPIRDYEENMAGVVLVFRNITERRMLESQGVRRDKIERSSKSWRDDKPITMMLVASSDLVREGIHRMVEPETGLKVVAKASSSLEIIPIIEKKMPDILIVDAEMPGLKIDKILESIGKKGIGTKLMLFLRTVDENLIMDAISMGARGCITDTSDREQFVQAIKTVHNNKIWTEVDILTKILTRLLPLKKAKLMLPEQKLTRREQEISRLVVKGYSNKQISSKLFISAKTVKAHLRNVYKKSGLGSRFQLTAEFYNK